MSKRKPHAEDGYEQRFPLLEGHRDGETYEPAVDLAPLNAQAQRVYAVIKDGAWYTLAQIASLTGDPEASVSARLRDLRKDRFGGMNIQRSRPKGTRLWEYRLAQGGER